MTLEEFNKIDSKSIPGTIVGLYPAKRFYNPTDAFNVVRDWPSNRAGKDYYVTIVHNGEKVLFNVVAFLDEETGEVIGFL